MNNLAIVRDFVSRVTQVGESEWRDESQSEAVGGEQRATVRVELVVAVWINQKELGKRQETRDDVKGERESVASERYNSEGGVEGG